MKPPPVPTVAELTAIIRDMQDVDLHMAHGCVLHAEATYRGQRYAWEPRAQDVLTRDHQITIMMNLAVVVWGWIYAPVSVSPEGA